MPVVVERVALREKAPDEGVRSLRPDLQEGGVARLDIGLINNMPDAALESTERQFVELLDAASKNTIVRLWLFSLPDVPRSEAARRQLSSSYSDITELWNCRLDGLIVTGTEPRAPSLTDEPYWGSFTKVADWAEDSAVSTVWSCLAAHAAVLHLDGVGRHALANKRFGVFDCASVSAHPLLDGIASPMRVAHSRWNELREDELALAEYVILTRSAGAGVDLFLKQRKSLFVFFQGHPEYDERALLREYRRDVGRYLSGQRETYPAVPQGYIDDVATGVLAAFRKLALSRRREDLLADFPTALVEGRLRPMSGSAAARVYGNWLSHLVAQKAQGAKSKTLAASPRWRRATESHPVQGIG
jgi:homoserine O-succinyltransferase/O-acetyltransferase